MLGISLTVNLYLRQAIQLTQTNIHLLIMKKQVQLIIATIFLTASTSWGQDIINPVSATTTFTAMFDSNLDNTINGGGLEDFPSLTATHEATNPFNSFLATNEEGSIDFDLGGSFNIDGFTFWNINGPGPGMAGIQDVVVSFSVDGTTFTPIDGSPTTFAQAMGPTSPAESFTFTTIIASFIRFDVTSNYGDPGGLIAFAEVAFSGSISDVSITDNILSDAVSVYPNPATAIINISNSSNLDINAVSVFDMNGRLIKHDALIDNYVNNQIDISDLNTGIYMIQISSDETSTFKKVIIK